MLYKILLSRFLNYNDVLREVNVLKEIYPMMSNNHRNSSWIGLETIPDDYYCESHDGITKGKEFIDWIISLG